MYEVSLRETRDLFKQIREDILLRPSGLRPVYPIYVRRSGSRSDTAAVRPRDQGDKMDRDRPMADRLYLLKSRLQESVRQTIEEDDRIIKRQQEFLNSLIPNNDRETSNVGAQDEASETREMGDGVRQKPDLTLEPLVEQMLKNRHRAEREAFLQGFEEGWADGCKIFERYLSQNGIELPSAKPQVSEPL